MKKILLTCFLALSFHLSYSQGESCIAPIVLDSTNNGSLFSQNNSEQWFSFIAPSQGVKIFLEIQGGLPVETHVHGVYVFSNNCFDTLDYSTIPGPQQGTQDTIVVHTNVLIPGQNYLVKALRKPSCAKCIAPVNYKLSYESEALVNCNWFAPNTNLQVVPCTAPVFYNFSTISTLASGYYCLRGYTSGNLYLDDVMTISWGQGSASVPAITPTNTVVPTWNSNNCIAVPFHYFLSANPAANPPNPIGMEISIAQVPCNASPGAQCCVHLEVINLLGQVACELDFCITICNNAPTVTSETICQGGCTQIATTNATDFDWYINSVLPANLIGQGISIQLCPTATTQYYAAPTQGSTCGNEPIHFTVIVVDAPLANFTFTNENCQGVGITFTNTTNNTNSYTYLWDFGDGSTSNNIQEFHGYAQPGTYTVTLTATIFNLGCVETHTEIVNVTPALCMLEGGIGDNPYNCGCCTYTYPYTLNNFTISDASTLATFNSTLSANANVISIKDYLVVNSDMLVNLTGVTIEFGPWGGIIIEPGCQLNLDGCVMKGLNMCGTMWQGIHVYGDNSKSQVATKPSTNRPWQGKLVLTNGTIIRDAHNGITVGKIISGLIYDPLLSGGIVDASPNTQINDCGYSIKIFPYSNVMNTSRFEEIKFNTSLISAGACLDPGYWSGNTLYVYNGPNNPYNPNYAYHNNLASFVYRGKTDMHVMMFNIRSIRFWGCDFRNSKVGMNAWNCKFNVQPKILGNSPRNQFIGINSGIQSFNWLNAPFINQTVVETDFTNVAGNDLWITGSRQSFFTRNITINNTNVQSNKFCSVYYSGCGGIFNYDNQYTNNLFGVRSFNSTTGGGIIGYQTVGNIFTNAKIGIQASNNPNLQIRCNSFVPSIQPGQYTSNWVVSVALPSQGSFSTTDPKAPAGNEFLIGTQKQINSTTASSFTYFRHSSSVSSTQSVTPIPVGNVGVVNNFLQKTATSCDPPCPGCGIHSLTTLFQNQNANLSQLDNEITSHEATLDGGQTSVLINAINGGMTDGELQQLLINNSPLSDEVILALVNRTNPVSNGHFKNIMERNMPVSDEVWIVLAPTLDGLPPGIANQLRPLQFHNPNYTTLTSLHRKRTSLINLRQLTLNELVFQYTELSDTSNIIALLQAENTFEAKSSLVSLYLDAEQPQQASTVLNDIEPMSPDEQAFVDLSNVLIDLSEQGKTIAEIDDSQEQVIRNVAALPDYTQPVRSAQAILNLLYGEPMPDDTLAGSGLRLQNQTQDQTGTQVNHLINAPYPNPSTDNVTIPCTVPDETNGAVLNIYDACGKLIEAYSLTIGLNLIMINTSSYTAGMYTCSLSIDGADIESVSFQVVRE